MKLMSGTFDKPNKILSIAIKYQNEGWIEYPDTLGGLDVDKTKELLVVVRKYKKTTPTTGGSNG